MSVANIICDQAIFTSIRTPMGEGYRIVAASKGIRPEEKKAILRSSPSHESFCTPFDTGYLHEEPLALAFYPLRTGRLCVALSCFAGEEHTGRGGKRVYTHNVVLEPEVFPQCGYNPFAIVRGMIAAGVNQPQLKPAPTLPELSLAVQTDLPELFADTWDNLWCEGCDPTWYAHALDQVFEERQVLIHVPGGYSCAIETLLMGIPGPLRATISFSSGLRFSASRAHQLIVQSTGERQTARTRVAKSRSVLIEPTSEPAPQETQSAWSGFVLRHVSHGAVELLCQRTSLAFADASGPGREFIATLYNDQDRAKCAQLEELFDAAERYTIPTNTYPEDTVELELYSQVASYVFQELSDRLTTASWPDLQPSWPRLIAIAVRSPQAQTLMEPVLQAALRCAIRDNPLQAADAAFDSLERAAWTTLPSGEILLIEAWSRLAEQARYANSQPADITERIAHWESRYPNEPRLEKLRELYSSATSKS